MRSLVLSLVTVLELLAMTADAEAGRRRRTNCCPCPSPASGVNAVQPPVNVGTIVSPSGKEYRFHVASNTPNDKEVRNRSTYGTPSVSVPDEPIQRSSLVPAGAYFIGRNRASVKASIVKNVPQETFASPADLRRTLRADD